MRKEREKNVEQGDVFYEVEGVPVNSVNLMRSVEAARDIRRSEIALGLDRETGIIHNLAFDESLVTYADEYEETQGFSETFNAFHERLAKDLVRRFGLRNRRIVEIGCGKGEFLNLLCNMGPNAGVGFDPAYDPARNESSVGGEIRFVRDFFSPKYAPLEADFVCCKMTLEHIRDATGFVRTIRDSLVPASFPVVFFQVPDTRRVLRDLAFWDIYYEHCSYFTDESLARLFRRQGFEVVQTWTDYQDQYLMVEARLLRQPDERYGQDLADNERTEGDITFFRQNVKSRLAAWESFLQRVRASEAKIVLWGGGSKAVAFLTTLKTIEPVVGAVDINPYKQGTYLAGCALPILAKGDLPSINPDFIIVMNPIYDAEIREDLVNLNVSAEVLPIDAEESQLRVTAREG